MNAFAPDLALAREYENLFYQTCAPERIGKLMAHLELYKMILPIDGSIAEFGVFKGASFSRFCAFRALLEAGKTRHIIGFDSFGTFPPAGDAGEAEKLAAFIAEAGDQSIDRATFAQLLQSRNLHENVELVAGDICTTLPHYIAQNPDTQFALVNLDVDLYAPSRVVLEHVWQRITPGGVLILDNYNVFPGETRAVHEILGTDIEILKFPFSATPSYTIKKV